MVSGKYKSRTFRRIRRRTPKGKVKQVYKRRKPKKAVCGSCGAALKGTARELPTKMKNLPKTKKRPQRPFGGVLCSRCMRKVMVAKARAVASTSTSTSTSASTSALTKAGLKND